MSTQDVFVQQFSQLFHHYQEALTPATDGDDRSQPENWRALAPEQRNRLVAAARLAIMEMETNARLEESSRKYFAKPGEAEWGC
jgi:hypothetical protein